jgi:hypothetical protein
MATWLKGLNAIMGWCVVEVRVPAQLNGEEHSVLMCALVAMETGVAVVPGASAATAPLVTGYKA